MTALDKLIEAVEAGDLKRLSAHDVKQAIGMHGFAYLHSVVQHNSLDAALALHEALLPGWWFQTSSVDGWATCYVERSGAGVPEEAPSAAETPARAWLLAVLRAYRSVQA